MFIADRQRPDVVRLSNPKVRAPARSFGPVAGLYSAGRGFAPPGSTKPATRSSPFGSRSLAPSLPSVAARCACRCVQPHPCMIAAVARSLRSHRRRLSPTSENRPSRSVASLRRRLRPPRRPSAARLPPRPRNRLGAYAPSPLLVHSPDIRLIGYRPRLIALRAISPSRAWRFAPARSEWVARFALRLAPHGSALSRLRRSRFPRAWRTADASARCFAPSPNVCSPCPSPARTGPPPRLAVLRTASPFHARRFAPSLRPHRRPTLTSAAHCAGNPDFAAFRPVLAEHRALRALALNSSRRSPPPIAVFSQASQIRWPAPSTLAPLA